MAGFPILTLFAPLRCALPKTHSRAAAIFVNKFDADFDQSISNGSDRKQRHLASFFFKIDHRRQSQFGEVRKFGLGDL